MSDGPADLDLFRAWQGGDTQAGSQLVERHFASVYRFFRAKVGDEAEELTQKTFLGCVEGRQRFDERRDFRGYLFGIARKQLLRHFEGRGALGADVFSRLSIADLAPTPSRLAAGRQQVQRLLDAMHSLPVDDQLAIELVYWEGLPLADVAEVVAVPVGTIKSRLHRARKQLADAMQASGSGSASLEDQARALRKALDHPTE